LPESSDDQELEIMRCRAWIGLAEEMIFTEHHQEAFALLDRAQAKATEHQLLDDLAAIHSLRGNLHYHGNRFEDSLVQQEKARDYAHQASSPEREARALSGLGDADYMRGHIISAYQHFDRCIALCREHHFSDIEAASLSMRGLTRFFQNDLASALQDGLNAAAIASSIRHRRAEAVARSSCIPWTLFEMGHIHQARRELQEALKMARELGARRLEPLSLTHLARVMALKGRRAKARALVQDSLRACREIGMAFAGPMALGALALITEDAAERQDALDEAQEILQGGAASHNHLYFYRDAMNIALELGEPESVERHALALERYASVEPLPWSRFFVERGRALAAHLRGQGEGEHLRALVSEARKASLHTAARALEQALVLPSS
jgi:tetratricopeptide (TPR) repeat protein